MNKLRRNLIKSIAIAGAGLSVPLTVMASNNQALPDMDWLINERARFDRLWDTCEKAILVMDCLPHTKHMIQVGPGQIDEAISILKSLMQRPDNLFDGKRINHGVSTCKDLSWGYVAARVRPSQRKAAVTIFEEFSDYHLLVARSALFRDISFR